MAWYEEQALGLSTELASVGPSAQLSQPEKGSGSPTVVFPARLRLGQAEPCPEGREGHPSCCVPHAMAPQDSLAQDIELGTFWTC